MVGDSESSPRRVVAHFSASTQRLRPRAQFVDGLDVLDARDRARRVVILQALADARQRVTHLDAERLQQFRRADAGQLQHLRRVVGAAGQNDFLAGAHLDRACRRVPPLR